MTEGAMTAFLTSIGEVFTQAMTWTGDVLDFIVTNPATLVMCLAMPIIGFACGLLGRLFNVR